MMTQSDLEVFVKQWLQAWNSQDIDSVLACYADDFSYRDPATRGEIRGAGEMRRYLQRLFAVWQMQWKVREAYLFAAGHGAAVLWSAVLRKLDTPETVAIEGMDLILLDGDRICRNEVYFDRGALASLT